MNYEELKEIDLGNGITKEDLKLLDDWLSKIPYRNRVNLNPKSFSIHCKVEVNKAVSLYKEAVRVGVLDKVYNIVTDDSMDSLGVFNNKEEIPEFIYNEELGEEIKIMGKNVEIKYKLKTQKA